KAAMTEQVQDLEAVLDDVAHGVVRGFRIRRCAGKIAEVGRRGLADAAGASGASRARWHVLDSPDGVRQTRMQHVRGYVRREVKLVCVAHRVEAALPEFVDVPEQAVLPQDGREVGGLLKVQ